MIISFTVFLIYSDWCSFHTFSIRGRGLQIRNKKAGFERRGPGRQGSNKRRYQVASLGNVRYVWELSPCTGMKVWIS